MRLLYPSYRHMLNVVCRIPGSQALDHLFIQLRNVQYICSKPRYTYRISKHSH